MNTSKKVASKLMGLEMTCGNCKYCRKVKTQSSGTRGTGLWWVCEFYDDTLFSLGGFCKDCKHFSPKTSKESE